MGPILIISSAIGLFLVLYNNSNNGLLNLLVLIFLNAAMLGLTFLRWPRLVCPKATRFICLCLAASSLSFLGLELVFPIVWPHEYSEIRNLTTVTDELASKGISHFDDVFINSDQKIVQKDGSVLPGDGMAVSWHVPNAWAAYYGFDPNTGTKYANVFKWNSDGYFDHDYTPERSRGTNRIVVIGDSYVEAVQVPLSKSFHKLLEWNLNHVVAEESGQRFEVIALGDSGTGQANNLEVLRNQAVKYDPDTVIMTLASNDVCDDDPILKRDLILASGMITPEIRGLAKHKYFSAAFAVRRIQDLRRNQVRMSPELLQWSQRNYPEIEDAWNRTLSFVKASSDYCSSRGIKFLLVYLGADLEVRYANDPGGTISRLKAMGGPHQDESWDFTRSVRRVSEYCQDNGIRFLSLLEPLIDAQRETGKNVFGDHYTFFGHAVAAQVLECSLVKALGYFSDNHQAAGNCCSSDSWTNAWVVAASAPGSSGKLMGVAPSMGVGEPR
jgi:hypothetical protein